MNLHVEVNGQGEPLLLLHGWGMHGAMWGDAAAQLAQHYRVHCIDLPGHGLSQAQDGAESFSFTLEALVDALSARFDFPLTLLGWSLGGQVALRWAAHAPETVRRLILVSSTPCFTQRADWPHAMPLTTLQQFAADLERDHAATLRRFLGLQLRGSTDERAWLGILRAQLASRREAQPWALRGGLDILRDADLRAELAQIHQPALVIAGERDSLCPPQASYHLVRAMPQSRWVKMAGAAHVPFLSHREQFLAQVERFMESSH